ncbi:Enolase-phosphatase E1 [Blomia tropicalis]|nr:Enolase-phosphatase E1 [Blomia tropicalis]
MSYNYDTKIHVQKPKVILCDIEGTTTSITFVKDILFPYVKQTIHQYLYTNFDTDETKLDIALLWEQYLIDKTCGEDLPSIDNFMNESEAKTNRIKSVIKYVLWQMDHDKKTTSLKQLQGHIWFDGYECGNLKGHVYDEVPKKFKEWQSNGITIAIYSSGSVLAQKLLFGHTKFGDLTKYIQHYFDTKIGPKREVDSYREICSALQVSPGDVLFLTDIIQEATASISAGIDSIILARDEQTIDSNFKTIANFDQLVFDQ